LKRAPFLFLIAVTVHAQGWRQWGQNPRHSGAVPVAAQRPDRVLGKFTYDNLADQMRQSGNGNLLVHYMAPLVDGDEVFIMSRGDSQWISCRSAEPPCGAQRWGQMEWGVTKLRTAGGTLEKQWTAISSWKPAPDNGSGWEQVFHPALFGGYVYVPGEAGMLMKFDRQSGELVDCLQPFDEKDPNRFVTSPLTIDADGSIYYTVMKLDAAEPWTKDVQEAFLVKADSMGRTLKISFAELVRDAPVDGCATTFAADALPWPPAPDAKPPVAPCGSQRPGMNAAPAVGLDGTVYVISRAHFNSAHGYLVALNADLTPKWSASLRDRLSDGCDVLLPPSGMLGGCREGSLRGVDPATNEMPAGRVLDQSTASPVIAPDGSVLYGAYTRYNYGRGHLLRFSSTGEYLSAYDFGWDITPAIYEHDGTWAAIVKDNFYPTGTYCDVLGYCGQGDPRYNLTSLGPDLRTEWTYQNTNDQACERLADGSLSCDTERDGFEWCVNMVAVDRDGVVHANSEDGNLYAIDRAGKMIGRLFLKVAIGAAYTPLAIGNDGRVYTQNDGTLFMIGER
jgi:outer membrane protein assembly factor BamB